MTLQELAQRILEIAHKALAKPTVVYIGDDQGFWDDHAALEAIVALCQEVPKDQEAYKQFEKKEKAKP